MSLRSRGHDSGTFVTLLDAIGEFYSTGRGHLVFDNLAGHDTDEMLEWFEEHPHWTRHFTPKDASWLNQVECAFSLLGRHLLARESFRSLEELCERVYAYAVRHPDEHRFVDRLDHPAHRLLDDLVLQRRDAERTCATIAFRDVHAPNGLGVIAAAMDAAT